VAGGRVGLRVDPLLLAHLTAGRQVALVSGTNGKTTTTRLLSVALQADGALVVSNETGSNMPPGHVAALAAPGRRGWGRTGRTGGSDRTGRVVLETDEIYLPRVMAATGAVTVVLLNLSRDQLDRTNEVRMVAGRWRAALAAAPHTTVVANADDPLVVWGAGAAAQVIWVGAGLGWHLDAVGCPSCGGRIAYDDVSVSGGGGGGGGWACSNGCGFRRPELAAALVGDPQKGSGPYRGEWADGRSFEIALALPGRFNHANALMAAVAAERHGIEVGDALRAMSEVEQVAGRFTVGHFGDVPARLMLAKNPAGWSELLDLVGGDEGPLVVSINARIADGGDPSWLWDVPFEQLAGRVVVATGDRCRDLSVRLKYAGVVHTVEADPVGAVSAAGQAAAGGDGTVDVIGNYTAFNDLLKAGR
jgi:UDP-N-acetylmuramyl tripeptide synthase